MTTRQRIGLAVGVALMCGVLAGCGSSASAGSSKATTAESSKAATGSSGAQKPVTLVLSNNFMGNQWRPQMVNIAKYVAGSSKYSGKLEFSVKLSEPTPASQISSLQGIIREKPDAIMVDAASPTALNPTIAQACAAGITVISFDQTVTAPCALKIGENYGADATAELSWLAAELKGKGKILMDKGLAGVVLSSEMVKTWESEIKSKYPGISIVGTYESEFTESVEQQAVSNQLAQHPEVNGVLSEVSCSAVINAFEKAGRTPVPVGCNAYNSGQIKCVEKDVPCFFYTTPAYIGGIAVERAYEVVAEKRKQPNFEYISPPFVVSPKGEVEFPVKGEVEPLEAGKNYYPHNSPALSTPVTYPGWKITPAIALGH